jgi:hypothetical protein
LVLRLASLLWRLRRATTIETGLFELHARHLLEFRRCREGHQKREQITDGIYRNPVSLEDNIGQNREAEPTLDRAGSADPGASSDDVTRSFVRLSNLPACPLDRLSRYEAALWRQACQVMLTLQCLSRRSWERPRRR